MAGLIALVTNSDRILRPFDDVDLLAAQLADDRLDARALHADAGADRVDVALARVDRHLGAIARLAHRAANHHGAVVDLRHFLLEQLDQQRRIRARQHDLRSLGAAVDAADHRADAVADGVVLRARLFLARQLRLDAAELHDDVAVLEPLDDAVDDLADALAVLGVDVLALGLADLLEDHLLGGLRRDPPEVLGRPRELDLHVDFRFVAVELLRFGQRDLVRRIGDLVDDALDRAELDLSGLGD